MATFFTDTGSLGRLDVSGSSTLSGSSNVLHVKGSGSAIVVVSGSAGGIMEISDIGSSSDLFVVSSGSIDLFKISNAVSNQLLAVQSGSTTVLSVESESVVITGSLTVDIDNIPDVFSAAGFTGTKNGYLEVYAQNLSFGVSASTDIVAYANTGTDTSSFIDMGINGSATARGYNYGGPLDAYVYNTGGNLYIGNNTAFYQPTSPSQSVFFFSNANATPEVALTGSRVGIGKTGSLQATLDVSGSVFITGSLRVSQGITASIFGSSSYALTASFALNGGGGGGGEGFPYAGTALITGSIVLTSGSGFPSLLASETLAAGDFVNVFSGGVRKASSNDLTKQAHGFVSASYSSTNPVIVYYSGLNTGLTGLTAGARYFLSASGAESTTPPTATAQLSQEVGVAIATNAILVNFGPAIIT
jgi:hypothetical protein